MVTYTRLLNIKTILLADQSGVPFKTVIRWWYIARWI